MTERSTSEFLAIAGELYEWAVRLVSRLGVVHEPDQHDIVQISFMHAGKKWSTFDPSRHPDKPLKEAARTWIRGILIKNVHEHFRQRSRNPLIATDDPLETLQSHDDDPSTAMEKREQTSRYMKALDSLSEGQRMVVVLVVFEELSYGEASNMLGIPIGTVGSRYNTAKQILTPILLRLRGMQ